MQFPIIPISAILVVASLVNGCAQPVELHGNRINTKSLKEIIPGTSTEKDVLKILGTPVIKQEYGAQNWIYIRSKSQKTVFSGKKFSERVVVRISFNQKGIATSVKMIPNDPHLSIDFAKRKTPTAGQEITILQQLIGNFGRFENKNDQSF